MTATIRASVLVEPGRYEVQEFAYPTLEPGAMVIAMRMSGICGTDKHGYRGEAVQYAGTEREVYGPYPAIPGHENVGIITDITREARHAMEFYGAELKEGDRVIIAPDIVCGHCYQCRHSFGYAWCDNIRSYGHLRSDQGPCLLGGWAESMYVLPGSHVFKLADDISDELAVLAEPMAVTYSLDIARSHSALPNDGFLSGSTVVVIGVGPLGLCHVIKARLLGAGLIIAIDRSQPRLRWAARLGADITLDALGESGDRLESVRALTHGRGADVVVECAGVPDAVLEGLELLRSGGTFIEVGNFVETGTITISPHRHLCAKNLRLIGMTNLAYVGFMPSLQLLQKHRSELPLDEMVTDRFPFEQAEAAVLRSMDPESIKVVIAP